MELTDQHILVLLGIRDIFTYRDMAKSLGRSVGHVQALVRQLAEEEYIVKQSPDKKRATPWRIAKLGLEFLRNHGYSI